MRFPALALFLLLATSVRAATLTVTTTADSGPGSLRQAILDANANPGHDIVAFAIPGAGPHVIAPLTNLPPIIEGSTIDGYTQPGSVPNSDPVAMNAVLKIVLDGTDARDDGLHTTGQHVTIRGIVAIRFRNAGFRISANANFVRGCFAGIREDGVTVAPNGFDGVRVDAGNDTWIGGDLPPHRNLLSGNDKAGVRVSFPATLTHIQGNLAGTDRTGTLRRGNETGVYVGGARDVGVSYNVLSGNDLDGVEVAGVAWSVGIRNNRIGTDPSGALAVANAYRGVFVGSSSYRVFVGTNTIAFNGTGIAVWDHCTSYVHMLENIIRDNAEYGVYVRDARYNTLERNQITGNGFAGVHVISDDPWRGERQWNRLRSNSITGNAQEGVNFWARGNSVEMNAITGNGGAGVRIRFPYANDNLVEANTIGSNGGPGIVVHDGAVNNRLSANVAAAIDLGNDGPTPNDALDADAGPNRLQNFPLLTSAEAHSTRTAVNGTLHSVPSTTFTIEFFGPEYLGALSVTTDVTGNAAFNATSLSPSTGDAIRATATNESTGDTSELSPVVVATRFGPPQIPIAAAQVDDIVVREGQVATFTVRLSNFLSPSRTIRVTPVAETATTADFIPVGGTLTFPPGGPNQEIQVATIDDAIAEGTEAFRIILSDPVDATIVEVSARARIIDNDARITIEDASATEGGTLNFDLTLTPAVDHEVEVRLTTGGGTAISGGDYTFTDTITRFLPCQTSLRIPVQTTQDLRDEPNETLVATLAANNATIGDSEAVGIIVDDDPAPALRISDPNVNEGGTAIFEVTLTGLTTQTVTVNLATADDTATSTDYFARSGSLTFLPGETSKFFSVITRVDTLDELDERFFLNLSGAVNATIAEAQGIGTILDDDDASDLSLSVHALAPVARPGGTLTYQILVTNNGPFPAPHAQVNGVPPSGSTFVSETSSSGICSGNICNLGTLAPGATVSITMHFLAPATPGTAAFTATATSQNPDPVLANNSATATANVVALGPDIPTLSEYALIFLAIAIAFAAVRVLRV